MNRPYLKENGVGAYCYTAILIVKKLLAAINLHNLH